MGTAAYRRHEKYGRESERFDIIGPANHGLNGPVMLTFPISLHDEIADYAARHCTGNIIMERTPFACIVKCQNDKDAVLLKMVF